MEFGLRTGSGRLFRTDGPAMAKARRPYVSIRGEVVRAVDFAQGNSLKPQAQLLMMSHLEYLTPTYNTGPISAYYRISI